MLNILLILALPFVFAALMTRPIGSGISKLLNPGLLLGGVMAIMFVLLFGTAYNPVIVEQGAATYTLSWVPQYSLELSFYLDSLSLLFGLIITGVGTIIFLYTGYYFDDPDERVRFLRPLLIFTGAMLWLVLSSNVVALFVAWELTSITSFLLIGFKGDKYQSARKGAARALVVTGGGGLALLVGLMLLGAAGGSYELSELLTMDLSAHEWYIPMTLLIMLGAFTKSAQFPFHFWLPGAMDAPTPASAFLHSATMVKAGVYLLARLHPTLSGTEFWSMGLLGVGVTTLFISSLLSVQQKDLKGLLAFTTTAKLGALVALLGVPGGYGVKAALVGILAHALYKSALFLSVGSIDHATGTRLIPRLGGLWQKMPITGVVVIISALSMAGVPPLLGFVAKETLLEAFVGQPLSLALLFISVVFTAGAGYILIWDVFFRKPPEEVHFHALHRPLEYGPALLAAGTVVIGLFVTQLLVPLLTPLIPVEFKLVLFPGFNDIFWLSMTVLALGFIVFFIREPIRRIPDLKFNAMVAYDWVIGAAEWAADQVLKTQNGKLRHYLIVVIGVTMAIMLSGGVVVDVLAIGPVDLVNFSVIDILDVMLLVLAIGAAWYSVLTERHINAALALAIFGYAVGGVFLVEPSPDVALVQLLVETLATVVLVIMISRVDRDQRNAAIEVLKRPLTNVRDGFAKFRDITISLITGAVMSAFALVALVNRDNRDSIAGWHLDNADTQVGVTDVVSAILTDFRGTDTMIEIGVFAVCALGLLALLTINRQEGGEPNEVPIDLDSDSSIATPMIRVVASIVLPITLVVAIVHVLYGAKAPGDGFTAGVIAGLGVALYYVVFGYQQVRRRLSWLRPVRLLTAGLTLALLNAGFGLLAGAGWHGFIDLAPGLSFAGLKLTTTLIFEIAIALTVLGGVSLMLETIAYPTGVRTADDITLTAELKRVNPLPDISTDKQAGPTGD